MQPIKLLLVDDHAMFREALRAVLEQYEDMAVAGEAGDAESALQRAGELQPDVILMDINMPGCGGVEATAQILARYPEQKVIALTMFGTIDRIEAMILAGAQGYVPKGAAACELVRAIHIVAAGGVALDPAIAAQLAVRYRDLARCGGQAAAREGLSERELAILKLLAAGRNNSEISAGLGLTRYGLQQELSGICAKLHVLNRTDAVAAALEQGLIGPNP